MTNSLDPLEHIPPISNTLRAELQSFVAEPHQILERIPLMQRYASGVASDEDYMVVTRTMLSFWAGHAPSAHDLPETYRRFLESYLEALRQDVGSYSPAKQAEPVDELAFYYVLLGSGLGAKIILRNNLDKNFPKCNLFFLAQSSAPLWKDFTLCHLSAVPPARQLRVKKDSRRLFDSLLNEIQRIAE